MQPASGYKEGSFLASEMVQIMNISVKMFYFEVNEMLSGMSSCSWSSAKALKILLQICAIRLKILDPSDLKDSIKYTIMKQ